MSKFYPRLKNSFLVECPQFTKQLVIKTASGFYTQDSSISKPCYHNKTLQQHELAGEGFCG
jgi:hypothetical protein